MKIMPESKLIQPLPWAARASSMPYLPGGGHSVVATFREIVEAIDEHDGLPDARVVVAEGAEKPLRAQVEQLIPAGLVEHVNRDRLTVPPEVKRWMEAGDSFDLLQVIHRRVRYVGEMMSRLSVGPATTAELRDDASATYRLEWKTLDQIRRRVYWLSCLGYVENKTSKLFGLTEAGARVVERLEMGQPEDFPELDMDTEVQLPVLHPIINELVSGLSGDNLTSRNSVLGYVPRGKGESGIVESMALLVNACSPNISRSDLLAYVGEQFSVSESSFNAVLTTLTKSELVEQTGYNIFSPTEVGKAWIEDPTPYQLAVILHTKTLFFLEIIPLLEEVDRAPDLARVGMERYGLQRVDVAGIRSRLQVLKAADLIYESSNWRFSATPLGSALCRAVPLQVGQGGDSPSQAPGDGGAEYVADPSEALAEELMVSSIAADSPATLEKSVTAAFAYLGFEARHIGGGGKTDVLATVNSEAGESVRIIIDAKAARSGEVLENAVSFDTLREHRVHHKADYVVLVGPGFDSGRIRQRAAQHGVRLMTVGELSGIIKRHRALPLSAFEYLGFVSSDEKVRDAFEVKWKRLNRKSTLLGQVVAVLAEEARQGDEITGGALSSDQIYLIVREQVDQRPSAQDIEGVLDLLEHPIIGSVTKRGSNSRVPTYFLHDRPSLVAAKLEAVAASLKAIDVG